MSEKIPSFIFKTKNDTDMILKWVLVGVVIWFFYNRFKRNLYLEQKRKAEIDVRQSQSQYSKSAQSSTEDEFIDYEEVD